jgi:hypothetical protein
MPVVLCFAILALRVGYLKIYDCRLFFSVEREHGGAGFVHVFCAPRKKSMAKTAKP